MRLSMPRSSEWFHKFFGGLYGRVLAGSYRPQTSLRQARLAKRLLRLRKGQRVLDCPCGQGRLTIPLAEMGLEMTGLDITASFLRQGRADAGRHGLKIRFIRQDMRKIEFDGEFDAVLNWFTSFGYFNERENLEFCRRVRQALKPGGQFVIETMNKSWLHRHVQTAHDEVKNGVRIVSRCRWDARTSRIHNVWKLSRGHRSETLHFNLRIYSGPELRALLRQAGFRDIRLYAHTPKGAARLTRHAMRLIAVARL
jgi:ubiquinone/menaquinone biosynthesis C-methylase UbiE